MRLLDVGCGWGSLILYAAQHYGVTATGITLSRQQRDFVASRVGERNLNGRVDVRLQDYRGLESSARIQAGFDAVASIEMGEHVGEQNYQRYEEFVALLGEEIARVWRLYLAGGRLAFCEGRMGVDQILAVNPTEQGVAPMPSTRPWAGV